MTDEERIDYLTYTLAKLIQTIIHEKRITGRLQPVEIFQSLLDMQESLMEHDCVKGDTREIRI